MSEKQFIVLPNNVVWDNQLGEVVCRCILEGSGDAENVCQRLNEKQSELELLHCLISIMKEDKRFIKLIEDKRSELAFEPYSENGYDGYKCLDKIREKLYE